MKLRLILLLCLVSAELLAQLRLRWSVRHDIHYTRQTVDSMGNAYVVLPGLHTLDYRLRKMNAQGREVWTTAVRPGYVRKLATDKSGDVLLVGFDEIDTREEMFTRKVNDNGDELWDADYTNPNWRDAAPRDLALDSSGNIYVAAVGSTVTPLEEPQGSEGVLVKYSALGQELWVATLSGYEGQEWIAFTSVDVDPNGDAILTGVFHNTIHQDGADATGLVAKYTSGGERLWTATVPVATSFYFYSEVHGAVDAAGNVYVTGTAVDLATPLRTSILIEKRTSNGVREWTARYDSPVAEGFDDPIDIASDSEGNIIVAGSSSCGEMINCGNQRMLVLKYAPTGKTLWAARYSLPSICGMASDLTIDAGNHIYVSGISSRSDVPDEPEGPIERAASIIKYSPHGVRLWSVDGPQEEGPATVDLDQGLNVYLLGTVATEKYDQQQAPNAPDIIGIAQHLDEHGDLFLTALAFSHHPLSYLWFHNGVPVPDSSSQVLNATSNGEYHVEVSNRHGTVASPIAWVGMAPPDGHP